MNLKIQERLADDSNYRKGRVAPVEWHVIHYTANNGDTDEGNGQYFDEHAHLDASANYFIDEDSALISVRETDTSWHCGSETGRYVHPTCRNSNSLGYEMCSEKDVNGKYYITEATKKNTIELVADRLKAYGHGVDRVIRHYDVTGKSCPRPWVEDESQWLAFKTELQDRLEEENMVRYQRLSDIPNEWGFRNVVEKLMNAKIINGDGSDTIGNNDVIDLSYDQVRMLIFLYQGGAFDRKLIALGIEPSIKG